MVLICISCSRGVVGPVNVGREYGDRVPLMVSHLSGHNARAGRHYVLSNIVCFDYLCRTMAGKKNSLRQMKSFEAFKKKVSKNAKKGAYKQYQRPVPAKQPVKLDSVVVTAEPQVIVLAKPEVVLKSDSLITLTDIFFVTDSYTLVNEHYATLDSLGRFLRANTNLEVVISGHTDDTGTEHHNLELSVRRAEAVSAYLVQQGVSSEQVGFQGYGSSQPVAPNDSEEGRRINRRVEILMRNR